METETAVVDPAVQAPADAANAGGTGTGGTGTSTQVHGNARTFDGEFDPERARGLIDNLRGSERNLKQQLAEAQKVLKAREDAELSETQRTQRDLETYKGQVSSYEQRVRDLAVQNEVLAEASRLSIVDPRSAAKLLDGKAIQYDADGNPTNVKEELEKLLTASPWLKRQETATTTTTPPVVPPNTPPANPGRESTSTVTFTKAQLNDFTFYQANKAAILQAMKEGRITD